MAKATHTHESKLSESKNLKIEIQSPPIVWMNRWNLNQTKTKDESFKNNSTCWKVMKLLTRTLHTVTRFKTIRNYSQPILPPSWRYANSRNRKLYANTRNWTLYANSRNWTLLTWNELIFGWSMKVLVFLYEAVKMDNNFDFMEFFNLRSQLYYYK